METTDILLQQDNDTSPSPDLDLAEVRGALDELFTLAGQYRSGDEYLALMQFVANFRRYSAYNAMLVYAQMPGARYVLPAKQWYRDYGRTPIPNAQPLVLLRPGGPIMFGFDVSQTKGRELPRGFDNPFYCGDIFDEEQFARLLRNVRFDSVSVEMRSMGSTLGGYVRNANSPYHSIGLGITPAVGQVVSVDGEDIPVFASITLNSNLPDSTNFATLSHELGHLYCGHVGAPNPQWWPSRTTLDNNTREFEAESVSYLVCQRAGIETPAVEYLSGYLHENDEIPQISLESVFKAAQRIESLLTKKPKPRSKPTENR
ncbi:MAG: hypothetical protein DWQ08_13410 [Proteobacteria bacterium]|nr:MAG: hypothetical protein DWQ08_13410 [Pseudomonadota bacterium]